MNLFGTKKKQPKADVAGAVAGLRKNLDLIDKKEQALSQQIEDEHRQAKVAHKKKNLRGAKYHLQKKKMYEKERDLLFQKRLNLDMQLITLENAQFNKSIVGTMADAARATKLQVNDRELDHAADVMEDMQEQMELANEYSETVAAPLGVQDEDELDAMMAEIEQENADEDLLDVPSVPMTSQVPTQRVETTEQKMASLPSAPNNNPVLAKPQADEMDELAALMEM